MTERQCIYLMNRMQKLGPVTYDRLLQLYGSAETAWQQKNPPVTGGQLAEWEAFHERKKERELKEELERLPEKHCRFLTREDPEFPEGLRRLYDCPIGIYLLGRLPEKESPSVGIIGARKCSEYGRSAAASLGKRMAECGIGVVSGMAMGIDSCGQWAALEAGGYSLAVLGSGIDVCYPSSSWNLYERLKERGGILSEYGPGDPGLPYHFPLRNRLISALSDVILVLEAREQSGTMITVDQALEQGKDVLAMPGRIHDPLSRGCHRLIAQGAGILTGPEDVLRVLGLSSEAPGTAGSSPETHGKRSRKASGSRPEPPAKERGCLPPEPPAKERGHLPSEPPAEKPAGLPPELAEVLALIGDEPVHQDELCRALHIPLTELFSRLWELEKREQIRRCSAGSVIRSTF